MIIEKRKGTHRVSKVKRNERISNGYVGTS